MAATGLEVFDRTVQKTNLLLGEIESEFGWEDRRHQSYAAFRIVLQALRDRMTVQEAANFAAQLPLLVKGVFFEGWNPSVVPIRMKPDEFFGRIRTEFQWSLDRSIQEMVVVVLRATCKHISEGQLDDIASILPSHLATEVRDLEIACAG